MRIFDLLFSLHIFAILNAPFNLPSQNREKLLTGIVSFIRFNHPFQNDTQSKGWEALRWRTQFHAHPLRLWASAAQDAAKQLLYRKLSVSLLPVGPRPWGAAEMFRHRSRRLSSCVFELVPRSVREFR